MYDIEVDPEPWMQESKCGTDKDLAQWQRENREDQFFDESSNKQDTLRAERIERAKEYCSDCPVFDDCLAFALRQQIDHGIYAGTTGRQRRSMRSKARKAALVFLAQRRVQLPDGSDPIAS